MSPHKALGAQEEAKKDLVDILKMYMPRNLNEILHTCSQTGSTLCQAIFWQNSALTGRENAQTAPTLVVALTTVNIERSERFKSTKNKVLVQRCTLDNQTEKHKTYTKNRFVASSLSLLLTT